MSDIKKHLRSTTKAPKGAKIGVVVSQYNSEITSKMLKSCCDELVKRGVLKKNIDVIEVPGAFELPFGCQKMAASKKYQAVIAIGCIIRGQTPHFDFIAKECARGIMNVSLTLSTPVVFAVLTTDNLAQANARIAGGKRGDKGVEAALTALNMINNLSKV